MVLKKGTHQEGEDEDEEECKLMPQRKRDTLNVVYVQDVKRKEKETETETVTMQKPHILTYTHPLCANTHIHTDTKNKQLLMIRKINSVLK